MEAGRRDDTSAAALSGADEAAVEHFLAGRCRFTDIARLLGRTLEAHRPVAAPRLDDLLAAEDWGYEYVNQTVTAGIA